MPTSARPPLPRTDPIEPPALALTRAERQVIDRLRSPLAVQQWLNALPYNTEKGGETLRSLRGVISTGTAHCLEAALSAAVIMEQHGYPPLVLSFESIDLLDHVIFVYRTSTGWGSVARSRDPGLHGRKPLFATPRALALSYVESYVDFTGGIKAYAVVDLRVMGEYDWRLSEKNVWKVEQMLLDWPHRRLIPSREKIAAMRRRYSRFRKAHGYKPWKYVQGPRALDSLAAGLRAAGLKAFFQSKSKSRVGLETGSVLACFSASSKRRVSASSRDFSASIDCSKSDSRRAASAATIRVASSSSGLSPRSGSRCETIRPRLTSTTSVDPQHGQVTSNSLFNFAI